MRGLRNLLLPPVYTVFSRIEATPQINRSHSLDKKIVNRSQSRKEDDFQSINIWRINYRAGTILESPRLTAALFGNKLIEAKACIRENMLFEGGLY